MADNEKTAGDAMGALVPKVAGTVSRLCGESRGHSSWAYPPLADSVADKLGITRLTEKQHDRMRGMLLDAIPSVAWNHKRGEFSRAAMVLQDPKNATRFAAFFIGCLLHVAGKASKPSTPDFSLRRNRGGVSADYSLD